MSSRIVYLDWVYEVSRRNLFDTGEQTVLAKEIVEEVNRAISKLAERDREFVRLYWFEGRPIDELASLFGKSRHNIESLNKCILRKLKTRLAAYVKERFGIDVDSERKCPICYHPERAAIDDLLLAKKESETFKPIYRELRERFGLKVSTPQILIGHMKYHIQREDPDD